jgi:hypothetical protein
VLAVVAPVPASASPQAGAAPVGLHAQGNLLLDGASPFQPRGFSLIASLAAACPSGAVPSDDAAAADHFGPDELNALVGTWHANTVRFQMSQKALAGAGAAAYAAVLAGDVDAAEGVGLKVILSMQDQGALACGDGNTMPTQATEDAWTNLLTDNPAFVGDPALMLEMFNEPLDNPAGFTPATRIPLPAPLWQQWHDGGSLDNKLNPEVGHQQLLTYLRSTLHVTNVLIADGLNRAGILPGASQGGYLLTDPAADIAYGVHPYFYTAPQPQADWDFRFGDLSATVPVIATEWNYLLSDCGNAPQTLAPTFLAYLSAHGIGALGYSGDGPQYLGTTHSLGLMNAGWDWTPTACPGLTPPAGPGIDFMASMATTVTAPPLLQSSPLAVTFGRPVQGVTTTDLSVALRPGLVAVSGTVSCLDAASAAVSCATGPVTTADFTPSAALAVGETLVVSVNATTPGVVGFSDGVPVAQSQTTVRAQTVVDALQYPVKYTWSKVSSSSALGGSYVREQYALATESFGATGTSVGLVTWDGPDGGTASVTVTTPGKPTVTQALDTYAPTQHDVTTTITGLPSGKHTVTVTVTGAHSAASTGTWVRIDATVILGVTKTTPTLTALWPNDSASASTAAKGATVSVKFWGTGLVWNALVGPAAGKAKVTIDGVTVAAAQDLFAPADGVQPIIFGGLSPSTLHTVVVTALGTRSTASTGTLVSVHDFTVE